ncbi:alpha/beta hydrolase [Streptomonospora litoralis]|uniref:Alpha/beta hydrolase family protein n=1 Tax=Streptomonospora litoralis TaxID=2498135 RepID=A0A4P6Q9U0_9ACTN|nr:alpha/beta hydrolase [Streptomonospora litoralis]QBI56431.1 Alpha/beta hydrolase family protein [Streptomonospora litoralis]
MPSTAAPMDTLFVLVHGAWHGAAHWGPAQRSLAALGAPSVALDLPGHGFAAPLPSGYFAANQPGMRTERSQAAGVSMDECADTVLETLRPVRGRARTVVLVAHSAGGGPASLAAERAPELVDRIVYLSAFVPAGRPRFYDYLSAPENAGALGGGLPVADPDEVGAVRINPVSTDPAYVAELRRTHYHDMPADRFDRWRTTLSPDLPMAIPSSPVTLTPQGWGRIPRTFLRCAGDRSLPTETQDLMIAEADAGFPANPFAVRTLAGSHSPFAARPGELAAALTADRSA